MKASGEQAAAMAWHNRNLHFVKNLMPMSEYLKPKSAPRTGDADVRRLFKRLMDKGAS